MSPPSDSKVHTIARLAQWKISVNFGSFPPYKTSDPFKIGIWNWHIRVQWDGSIMIRLYPELSLKEDTPLARFIIRVTTSRQHFTSPIYEKLLRTSGDFAWHVDMDLESRFVVEVEFLDLKVPSSVEGIGSIWPGDGTVRSPSTLERLSRMLDESIHTDVTINTSDGTLRAHKAVLCSSSPVFESMFRHGLRERESSTVDIEDMTSESCMALLSYFYGSLKREDFWRHRSALLGAADKYDVAELKEACEEGLLEDISGENVLERLQEASLYRLERLKRGCLTYLLDFGKIRDLKEEEMGSFFGRADGELVGELFRELIAVWKPPA